MVRSPTRREVLQAAITGSVITLAGCSADAPAARPATTSSAPDPRSSTSLTAGERPTASREAGNATATPNPAGEWGLELVGHALLSDPPGAYAEGVIRADGRYALLGSEFGTDGTFLVDIADPTTPRERHRLPTTGEMESADVIFDARAGLYYRSLERDGGGIDVVDYGYGDGTPSEPRILATMPAGDTHNLHVHPTEPVLYAVVDGGQTPGIGVWNVEDPANPDLQTEAGPTGSAHDVVVDPGRDLLHVAYIGGDLEGYVILDISDPWVPTEVGRFDYAEQPAYDEVPIGTAAFENCHFASFDPRRDLAIVGDETIAGPPGGKHLFDIGWGKGSPMNPIPVGFVRSPNAREMGQGADPFAWTGHNFDVVPREETTLLVSGDYADGAVLYDITDPTEPTALDRFETVLDRDRASGPSRYSGPPRAWSADYAPAPDLVVVSDVFTGLYVFRVDRRLS